MAEQPWTLDATAEAEWPKRADGSNMTMREMTPEQRRRMWTEAAARVKRRLESPGARAILAKAAPL